MPRSDLAHDLRLTGYFVTSGAVLDLIWERRAAPLVDRGWWLELGIRLALTYLTFRGLRWVWTQTGSTTLGLLFGRAVGRQAWHDAARRAAGRD